MPKFTDQTYLKTDQYRNADNLNARIELHQRFSTNPQGWFPWVWDTLEQLPQKARVLELGCGAGSLWTACPERIPAGWILTLSDLSEGMLQAAWRNLVVIGRGIKFEQIDAQSIPYPDETFDIIIANHMLYHVPDRCKALAEICRVLKLGGHLVAATNGEAHLKELGGWLRRVDVEYGAARPTSTFNLENAGAQLELYFSQITLNCYSDGLRITEIPPLLAYLHSFVRAGEALEAVLAEIEQELTAELQSKGAIYVTKAGGLFLAIK